MPSLLEGFAYGNPLPEPPDMRQNSRYRDVAEAAENLRQQLQKRLSDEDKYLFERYLDMQTELTDMTAVSNLTHGYSMGLVLTAEAFTGIYGMNDENE